MDVCIYWANPFWELNDWSSQRWKSLESWRCSDDTKFSTAWDMPRIPLASFPYCNIRQPFSQSSSVASCLLPLLAPPDFWKNCLSTFSPLQIPSPFCALMTSSALIFSFKQSLCCSQYQTCIWLTSPTHIDMVLLKHTLHPLPFSSLLTLPWEILVSCCSHSFAPVSLCLPDLVSLSLPTSQASLSIHSIKPSRAYTLVSLTVL